MDRGGQTSLASQHVAVYSLIFTPLTICQPNNLLKRAKSCVMLMQEKSSVLQSVQTNQDSILGVLKKKKDKAVIT